jgi:hypothetical protein
VRYFSLILFSLLFLGACSAPVTKQTLREQGGNKVTFSVQQPYQDVFATILNQTRQCLFYTPMEQQLYVNGKKNNRELSASVYVMLVYGKLNEEAFMLVDVEALGEQSTQVTAYYANNHAKKHALAVENWTSGESLECEV